MAQGSLAVAHAILGKRNEALAATRRYEVLVPPSKNEFMARERLRGTVYMIVGDHDAAILELEKQLSQPAGLSRNWVRLDDFYKPLRGNPRFQRLVALPKH